MQVNFVSDTGGCILVGKKFMKINKDDLKDVVNSRKTLGELVHHIPENGLKLKIDRI